MALSPECIAWVHGLHGKCMDRQEVRSEPDPYPNPYPCPLPAVRRTCTPAPDAFLGQAWSARLWVWGGGDGQGARFFAVEDKVTGLGQAWACHGRWHVLTDTLRPLRENPPLPGFRIGDRGPGLLSTTRHHWGGRRRRRSSVR